MKIAIPKERRPHERRVASTPEVVKKFVSLGFEVVVEQGAGLNSRFSDESYREAGATVAPDLESTFANADIVLKVQRPLMAEEGDIDELALIPKNALLIGMLAPYASDSNIKNYASANITAQSLELVPRISRAQSMDVLSSQSNLAGYRAVIDAVYLYERVMPMMMTAAGTVAPARVMVLGAGVAGLQAIATAKRLGAIVSATDVRPAAAEQVQSLGAKFVMVESDELKDAETAGGYAKEMSEDFKRKQAALVAETIKKQDIVITTALIPGRKAPQLVSEDMLKSMRPGSVVMDLAVEQGGNCAGSIPGEIVDVNGVSVVGHINIPSRLSSDASALYAKNVFQFVNLMVASQGEEQNGSASLSIPWEDEIISAATLTRDGEIIHPSFKPES